MQKLYSDFLLAKKEGSEKNPLKIGGQENVFIYLLETIGEKIGWKQSQIKILVKCIRANTSAIWQNMLHIPPTKLLIS